MSLLHPVEPDQLKADAKLLARRLLIEINGREDLCHLPGPIERDMLDMFNSGVARAFAHGQLVVLNAAQGRRTCRVCGCWELGACVSAAGAPCGWAGSNLCTACAPDIGHHG